MESELAMRKVASHLSLDKEAPSPSGGPAGEGVIEGESTGTYDQQDNGGVRYSEVKVLRFL